jgi:hypothetical protein
LSDWQRKVTAEYVPTDAQRSLVESASAFGITQAEILHNYLTNTSGMASLNARHYAK